MSTLSNSAPIEESFGPRGTAVFIWPDGLEGTNGKPLGVLTALELHSDAAQECQQLEASLTGVSRLEVLTQWEAEQDAATRWLEDRGLSVQWDSPAPLRPYAAGQALRTYFVAARASA